MAYKFGDIKTADDLRRVAGEQGVAPEITEKVLFLKQQIDEVNDILREANNRLNIHAPEGYLKVMKTLMPPKEFMDKLSPSKAAQARFTYKMLETAVTVQKLLQELADEYKEVEVLMEREEATVN